MIAGASVYLAFRFYRQKKEIQDLLHFLADDQYRIDPAARVLVELFTEIANASAQSAENEYLLAKRLHRILTATRGHGRTIKEDFLLLANLYDWGLLTHLEKTYQLTRGDLVLCGMITLNMEPACISKILGYDHERTFYNKRADVRKKLGLEHTVPLEGFLEEQIEMLRKEHQAYNLRIKTLN